VEANKKVAKIKSGSKEAELVFYTPHRGWEVQNKIALVLRLFLLPPHDFSLFSNVLCNLKYILTFEYIL